MLMVWCGSLHLAFPGDVEHACTNKWQKKKKNEKVTLHILTHVDFFGGLH